MSHRRTIPRPARRRAFTLIELLVVVTIILVLLGLITGVGIRVLQHQRVGVTQGVLSALDRALEEYMNLNAGKPPRYVFEDYLFVPGPDVSAGGSPYYFRTYPRDNPGPQPYPMRPDAAVFLRAAMGHGQVQSIVSGIGAAFVRITTTPHYPTDVGGLPPTSQWNRDTDVTPSVVDSWADSGWQEPWPMIEDPNFASVAGNPRTLQQLVFYVHPENVIAQALYGKCESGRPYFMSAGPDLFYGISYEHPYAAAHHGMSVGDYGNDDAKFRQAVMKKSRQDNVYSYPVKRDFDVDPYLATAGN